MKRGPRVFYASLTVITHTDLRTLKCCQCHMWNRYHPWNWAQNNQLTNPREEEATWPSTGEKHGPWGDFMKRLVASGPGTDDGVEKRTRAGGFHGQISSARFAGCSRKKKAWEPLMPLLTCLWLLTWTLAFQTPSFSTCQQSCQSLQVQDLLDLRRTFFFFL